MIGAVRRSLQPSIEDIKTAAFVEIPLIRTLAKRSQWGSASVQCTVAETEQCSTSKRFNGTSTALGTVLNLRYLGQYPALVLAHS